MIARARKWMTLAAALMLTAVIAEDVSAQRGRGGRARGGSVRHSGGASRATVGARSPTRRPGGYGSVRHVLGAANENRKDRIGARDNLPSLPSGAVNVKVGGKPYFRVGKACYQKKTINGQLHYIGVRPPIGWWIPRPLPPCPKWRWRDRWVYYWDDSYWEESEQEGEEGYAVIEDLPGDPADSEAAQDPNLYLTRASEFLARFEKISLEVDETMDELTEDGMEVERSAERRVWLRRPAEMKVSAKRDDARRLAYYDGQTLTLYDPESKQFGVAEVPGDVDSMLDTIAEQHQMVIPLADLLAASMVDSLTGTGLEGTYLGRHKVRNYPCDHLSFTSEMLDFEIWIEAGDRPVPRKFNITYKTRPGQPRYEAELSRWDLNARVSDRDFHFRPPDGSERIDQLPTLAETVQFGEPAE